MKLNLIISVVTIIMMTIANPVKSQEVATDSVKSSVNTASIIGTANSKGCFHGWVERGFIHVENCNGFYGSLVAGYSSLNYSNKAGSYSAGSAKFGVQVGYRKGMLRPEVGFFYTTPFEVEGRKYSAPELQVALNIDFNRHSMVDVYAAPSVGYKFVKSLSSKEDNTIPYDGNALMLGVKAGTLIKLCAPSHKKEVVIGGRKVTYYNHSQLFLKIEAGYQYGRVSKPADDVLKMHEISGCVGLIWKW